MSHPKNYLPTLSATIVPRYRPCDSESTPLPLIFAVFGSRRSGLWSVGTDTDHSGGFLTGSLVLTTSNRPTWTAARAAKNEG